MKCARVDWVEADFHVAFTLPGAFAPLMLQNPVVVYDLLFQAVAATLLEVAATSCT